MKKIVALAALVALSSLAQAQQASPVGLWKTIDDDGKTEKSLVRITEANGVLTGSIEKVFDTSKPGAVCDQCQDDRKNKPIVGLQIIRGVKQDADDKSLWTGGEILDPEKGKTYKTRLKPIEGGKKLEMRGYLGFFYRTQVWVRAE
ncbi:DUF2147 domain-containing protein [Burkholderiaceae bacterium UC74_6]